ncbi:MAG: sugar ABC transporter permease [Propionibacteriaceae bacterium]|jgi:raffinose/stachyose/melibiose transport system permease protein|nr:sugar ABC transporter permease [Propionibacteriaceae bacterium]
MKVRRGIGYLWILPAIMLLLVFVYYPIVENFRLSLYKWNAFQPEPKFVGLSNYERVFADEVFYTSIFNNVGYAVISVIFQVGIALVLAAVLEGVVAPRLRGLLRTIYFIPATISITIIGLLFRKIYEGEGLFNAFLGLFGIESAHAWLGETSTAIWSVIAMSQWQNLGYTTMLFVVAIQRIPREYYDAAAVDGAGPVRTFFSVTVPLVREMTTLLMIVTISGAFLVFNEIMATTQGSPGNSSQVLGTWLYQSAFKNDDMGYAAVVAVVIFAITFTAALLQLGYGRLRRVEL